jgi:Leucine-rich repeat (LRR) protein
MIFLLLLMLLALVAAQGPLLIDQYVALWSLLKDLNCTAEQCKEFAASSPCTTFSGQNALKCEGGNVTHLQLSSGLAGFINGPALAALTGLTFLRLHNGSLTTIPTQIGRLTALTQLDLTLASLTSSVPSQVGALSNLRWLTVRNNRLTGTLPALEALSHLTFLHVGSNVDLVGEIPTLPVSLETLYAHNCSFTAPPPNLSALGRLTIIWLYGNNLTGELSVSEQRVRIASCRRTGWEKPTA